MSYEASFTLALISGLLAALVFTSLPVDGLLIGAVVVLLLAGVLDASQALVGFSNTGVLTVGALYVVAAGLQQTGAVRLVATGLLGPTRDVRTALARLVFPSLAASAFLNNTPIVAALMPAVTDWSRRSGISVSKLLLPLSFAAILGGTCTLIGTSTNLVVAGLLVEAAPAHDRMAPLGLFDIAPIGVPLALVGAVLMVVLGPLVLPERKPPIRPDADPREFLTEMRVPEDSPLVGLPLEEAGLRLQGAWVAELVRGDRVMAAVSPSEILEGGDRLMFVGRRDSVLDLTLTAGLVPAGSAGEGEHPHVFVEVVVAPSNRLVGLSIRDGRFRTTFGAAVLAAARRGELLSGGIADVVLQPGDVLLLETTEEFARTHRNGADFYLVNVLDDVLPLRRREAVRAVAILAGVVLLAALEILSMLEASLLGAGAMIAARCLSIVQARRAVDLSVIVSIASAFALGEAIHVSGLDVSIAHRLLDLGSTPVAALVATYLVTMALTEMITNNAAAILVFPIAVALADRLGVSPMPFVVTVMFAASASFLTPIGYQTNLMVYGPGGYRFLDYVRLGGLMTAASFACTVLITPLVFPF